MPREQHRGTLKAAAPMNSVKSSQRTVLEYPGAATPWEKGKMWASTQCVLLVTQNHEASHFLEGPGGGVAREPCDIRSANIW